MPEHPPLTFAAWEQSVAPYSFQTSDLISHFRPLLLAAFNAGWVAALHQQLPVPDLTVREVCDLLESRTPSPPTLHTTLGEK